MSIQTQIMAPTRQVLTEQEIRDTLTRGLEHAFTHQRILVLIPDHTRTLPLPFLFRTIVEVLHDTKQLDFMVALGTHPPLTDEQLRKLVSLTYEERAQEYSRIGLFNHAWDNSSTLQTIGTITQDEVRQISGEHWHPSLRGDIPVRINKTIFDYDQILILGPSFPHEVVGFSGGAKYLFPGISGPEMINATHWLGALAGVVGTIGITDTPVRAMIHAAAEKLTIPIMLIALVVEGNDLAGLFIGDHLEAWRAAADLSTQRHIRWVEKPFQQVLSCAPPMYDELWTAAKAMYKLEPVVATGGEVIIYAPHLEEISFVHGKYIQEIGYHVLDYFLDQWDQFKNIPLGVLAHSTHVRGSGSFEKGRESPNVKVTLSSRIPAEICEQISLGYKNPAEIDVNKWKNREDEGILFVPKAGEMLYRVKH
jgi:nickel-dependent lactate racemase